MVLKYIIKFKNKFLIYLGVVWKETPLKLRNVFNWILTLDIVIFLESIISIDICELRKSLLFLSLDINMCSVTNKPDIFESTVQEGSRPAY